MFLNAEFLGKKGVQRHISRDEYIPETSKNNTLIFSAINIHFKIKPFKINISITFYRQTQYCNISTF